MGNLNWKSYSRLQQCYPPSKHLNAEIQTSIIYGAYHHQEKTQQLPVQIKCKTFIALVWCDLFIRKE